MQINPVRTVADLEVVRGLLRAYAASLEVDLAYQGFAVELATLPGTYAPPRGELLLARDVEVLGCVAMRALDAEICEMKRLYVRTEARGIGVGAALIEALLVVARQRGYREMCLDTLPAMTGAQALYRRLGFEAIRPYYDTPIAGTVFMRRLL